MSNKSPSPESSDSIPASKPAIRVMKQGYTSISVPDSSYEAMDAAFSKAAAINRPKSSVTRPAWSKAGQTARVKDLGMEAHRLNATEEDIVAFDSSLARLTPPSKAAIPSNEEDELIAFEQGVARHLGEAIGGPQMGAEIIPFEPAAAAVAPTAAPSGQIKKGPSLRAFVNTDVEFEASDWTYERIMDGLAQEGWRARDVEEVMKEGDLIHRSGDAPSVFVVERVQGLKDVVLTQEYIDCHQMTVYTLEGGGKKKAPPHGKMTSDFTSIYDVPATLGTIGNTKDKLELPTDETEAKRFFGVDVMVAEQMRKGKPTKVFFPSIPSLRDRKLRAAFSRVFAEFARKHLRGSLKGVIAGRGDGINLKRGLSLRHILDATQRKVGPFNLTEKPTLHTVCNLVQQQIEAETDATKRKGLKAKLSLYQNMDESTIDAVLARHDYRPRGIAARPQVPFVKRMEARKLTPMDYRYEKAIGIEIETLCPIHRDEAQKRVPHFVRAAEDRSIKDRKGRDTHGPDGNGEKQFGAEFRILIKRSELEARVGKAIKALDDIGAEVNPTCGMHVHFDMRGKSKEDVAALCDKVTRWLRVLIELVPVGRRTNKYCALENPEQAHWAGVSMDAFHKGKQETLEIRTHSATLSQIKIIRWVTLIETIMAMTFCPPLNLKTSTLDGLKMLPLSEADRTYWLKRHHQLNKELYVNAKGNVRTIAPDLSFLDKPSEVE